MNLDYQLALVIGLMNDRWETVASALVVLSPEGCPALQEFRRLCRLQEENATKLLGLGVENHIPPVLRDGEGASEVPRGQVRQDHEEKLSLCCISGCIQTFGRSKTYVANDSMSGTSPLTHRFQATLCSCALLPTGPTLSAKPQTIQKQTL